MNEMATLYCFVKNVSRTSFFYNGLITVLVDLRMLLHHFACVELFFM